MSESHPILLSALTGFFFGLLLSMPIGPVNLTIINGAAQRGFKYAALIGLGAATMDVIYCTIAFTGFSSFFGIRLVKTSMEVFTFVFMLFLGIKFLTAKTVVAPTQLGDTASRIEKRIDEKFHPHSAFMTGFVRVMGNLGVLLFWIVLAANLLSRDWVDDTPAGKSACIACVALGAITWFCALSYYVARRGYGRFSEKTLLRMERFSGICLLGIGLFDGANIAWKLAQHRM
ncbi:MAG TPA: LysE family transporter [Candidatus Acidoferrum sp.]|nr:LysE family transporter [Candidatus Acidoferrum sp.]